MKCWKCPPPCCKHKFILQAQMRHRRSKSIQSSHWWCGHWMRMTRIQGRRNCCRSSYISSTRLWGSITTSQRDTRHGMHMIIWWSQRFEWKFGAPIGLKGSVHNSLQVWMRMVQVMSWSFLIKNGALMWALQSITHIHKSRVCFFTFQ